MNIYVPQLRNRGVTVYDGHYQKPKVYSEAPPMMVDATKRYLARVETQKGDLVLE